MISNLRQSKSSEKHIPEFGDADGILAKGDLIGAGAQLLRSRGGSDFCGYNGTHEVMVMKNFCVLVTCALLLGGLVARHDTGSPQATAGPAQSTEATPAEEMDDKARILAAIEEASRYVDFSKGEVELRVLTTEDSQTTIIEVVNEIHKNDLTPLFLAIVNADGSLTHFNHGGIRKESTSSQALVKVLEFLLGRGPQSWISEFTARIENHADHTLVAMNRLPLSLGGITRLRVKGDEVTIEGRGRPNPSNGPDTTGTQ